MNGLGNLQLPILTLNAILDSKTALSIIFNGGHFPAANLFNSYYNFVFRSVIDNPVLGNFSITNRSRTRWSHLTNCVVICTSLFKFKILEYSRRF